jgi:T4 RnlA family RNA ligase
MEVIKYLNSKGGPDSAIEPLKEEYSIKVREYWDDGLFVLNYDQINSPKVHPITKECRGLILTYDREWRVVSRSFDRFFNLGESPEEYPYFDITKATCYEKIDGSLIKIYYWNGKWHVSTRGTAFAETATPMGDVFKDLVYKALGIEKDTDFQLWCIGHFESECTEVFELTSRENRVVTQYEGYKLWYLGTRHNHSGEYDYNPNITNGVCIPKKFTFSSVDSIIKSSKELKNLEEGYVCYQDGTPIVKVKSPAYVAVHHIRGEGTPSPKRIMQLVLMNEQDEYLKYFPEDEEFFTPYIMALLDLQMEMVKLWEEVKEVKDQKEFALVVKDKIYSAALFQAKATGGSPITMFNEQKESYKLKVLENYLKDAS